MWGQVFNKNRIFARRRIIPTRVGTRSGVSLATLADKDHPHACGDKIECKTTPSIVIGSSPRVWGQAGNDTLEKTGNRIIPTRVGTRTTFSFGSATFKDHPHACGDKEKNIIEEMDEEGSSPRVWGQVLDMIMKRNNVRIIPTRVGTS